VLLLDGFKNVILAVQKNQYMQLAEIVSVSQMPGIFQVVGKKQDGLIVKSLVDWQVAIYLWSYTYV
jgi:hypothetical protein